VVAAEETGALQQETDVPGYQGKHTSPSQAYPNVMLAPESQQSSTCRTRCKASVPVDSSDAAPVEMDIVSDESFKILYLFSGKDDHPGNMQDAANEIQSDNEKIEVCMFDTVNDKGFMTCLTRRCGGTS
jgi:tartrate dehydratase alpha subunit/fumarate hydratase class I-like protein